MQQQIHASDRSRLDHIIQAIVTGTVTGDLHIGDKIYPRSRLEELRTFLAPAAPNLMLALQHQITLRPDIPYKSLSPYNLGDGSIFFGRQNAIAQLEAKINQNRLVVLHAPSGAGKTSLLRAGLAPLLVNNHSIPVYVDDYSHPDAGIKRVLTSQNCDPWPELLTELTLIEFLAVFSRQLPRTIQGIVVFLDQFESFLMPQAVPDRMDNFIWQVASCVQDTSLPIRFVISIRSDFFSRLAVLEPVLPTIFHHQIYMLPMNRQEAQQAVTEPLSLLARPIEYELVLVDRLLDDLEGGGMSLPQLQIICCQLYESALQSGSEVISLDCYEKMGGSETILSQYLHQKLAEFGQEEDTARRILVELANVQEYENHLTEDDLAERLKLEQLTFQLVMQKLVQKRLLQCEEEAGKTRYFIVHEFLVRAIMSWMSPEQLERKSALERLRLETVNWRKRGEPIPAERFRLLHPRLAHLDIKEHDSLACLLISAFFAAGVGNGVSQPDTDQSGVEAVLHWLQKARLLTVDLVPLVSLVLGTDNFRVRSKAITILRLTGNPEWVPLLISCLSDVYPQVRAQAIRALEHLCVDLSWHGELSAECIVLAGIFLMGDEESDEVTDKPVSEINLPAFYIDRHVVTNRDYERYTQDQNIPFEVRAGQEDDPVIGMSWTEARAYATWAGKRLAAESEWEKAACWDPIHHRRRIYPWGDHFESSLCNTNESGFGKITPVGHFSPGGDGPYGCYDMAGNVWEWTSSLFFGYPYRKEDGREEPQIIGQRVVRGGSYQLNQAFAASAYRKAAPMEINAKDNPIGFRLVMDAKG